MSKEYTFIDRRLCILRHISYEGENVPEEKEAAA